MKRNILALFLTLAMVIGLLPHSAAAEETDTPVHLAAYTSSVTVDGQLNETDWLTYVQTSQGVFGALWDSSHIYLAILPNADTVTVSLDGVTISVDKSGVSGWDGAVSAWDTALELQLPYAVTSYNQSAALTVGDWSGTLRFSSLERTFHPTLTVTGTSSDSLGSTVDGDSITMYRRYQAGAENVDYRVYRGNYSTPPLISKTEASVLEFDFIANKLPVADVSGWINGCYACYGFNISTVDSNQKCYIAGIANTENGLYFCLNGSSRDLHTAVPMGKQVGDLFHVRLEWEQDGVLRLYVDDLLIQSFENTRLPQPWGSNVTNLLFFNLWDNSPLTEDGSGDVECTFSNVRMGNMVSTNVLEQLTFSTIAGTNTDADAITADLSLPAVWSNGQLEDAALTWSSSNPAVVSADGKVTPGAKDETVILTVCLTADPTVCKQFTLFVPRMSMDARLAAEPPVADGRMEESCWSMPRAFHVSEGITGQVCALWSKDYAWFAVEYSQADTLTLTLGEQTWNIDLLTGTADDGVFAAVTDGVAELQVRLAAAGIALTDYNRSYNFQLTLSGSQGTAALEESNILLNFTGDLITPIGIRGSNFMNGFSVSGNTATVSTTDTERKYWFKLDIDGMDHSRDLLLEQTLTVEAMPEGDGRFIGGLEARGYYFWMADTAGGTGNYITANLYNKDGMLTLRIRTADGFAEFPLNRTLGDTFRLGLLWTAEDKAAAYLDNVCIGTAENVTFVSGGTGNRAIALNYRSDTPAQSTIHVTDITFTTEKFTSLRDELSFAAVLPGVDPTAVASDLTLPTVYQSPYLGELPLSWSSSNEAALSGSGTVTRPEGKAGTYVDLTLSAFGSPLWTEEVYILPTIIPVAQTAAVLNVPFTAEAVVIDGQTTDEGWSLNTKLIYDGVSTGSFGAQWDMSNLYLAIETSGKDAAVTLNGQAVDLSAAVTADGLTECAIPLSALGLTVEDYGIRIPAVITLGDARWEGELLLTSTDWFTTDGTDPRGPISMAGTVAAGGDAPTANQGFEKTDNGWHLYDRYDRNGDNPTQIRTYVIFLKEEIMAPLNDRTLGTYAEFDFKATSMPVYTAASVTNWSSHFASYGLTWAITAAYKPGTQSSDAVVFGIFNTEKGLVLTASGANRQSFVTLNRQVGDEFRIGTRWETNGDATVYLDGEVYAVLEDVESVRSHLGSNVFSLNLIRSKEAAASRNDDFEITVSNLSIGKSHGDTVLDLLTEQTIRGENEDLYAATEDLTLPDSLYSQQLDLTTALQWSSSDPAVLDPATGTVTRPEGCGKLVLLTATAGDRTKTFEIYVCGLGTESDILCALQDQSTANGAGAIHDVYRFTLDENNNSIIRDLKTVSTVNVIALKDGDAYTRLNESVLTIWVSDDNVTYTQVDGFKLLRAGKMTYLYDFTATGRYIKVHCTHYNGTEADFIGPLEGMIDAYYEDVFGAAAGSFDSKTITVTNRTDADQWDQPWTLETEAQRVYLDGSLLYHYTENGKTVVRIPVVKAGETVSLTVLSGNADAMDISNKEYVYETVYGTREVVTPEQGTARWLCTLPDDVLMSIDGGYEEAKDGTLIWNHLVYSYSYDCGMTWTEPAVIEGSKGFCASVGGVAYDPYAGRIIVQGYELGGFDPADWTNSSCKLRFLCSDDLGKTWKRLEDATVEGTPSTYFLSYTDPQILSCYDGDGPNVDFVLPTGNQSPANDGFVCRIAYSTDAGLTWTLGEDLIAYDGSAYGGQPESGLSEGTILEGVDSNGVPALVLYVRCQYYDSNHFVRAYSYDWGKTWTQAERSDVYTVNTQPILYEFGDAQLLFWGGNNVLGGGSYSRFPLSAAVSYDGLQQFENIQNLYSCYSLQGMTTTYGSTVMNQSVDSIGDTMIIAWNNNRNERLLLMRVDHFTDYFFRTRGAYDSFEHSSVKYEGWDVTAGTVDVSGEQAAEGSRSMKLEDDSSAVRSIPYLQNGSVSLALYAETAAADLTLELESAYGTEFGKAAPIALQITDGIIGDTGLRLQKGWNSISFDLMLTEGTASITVNGETASLTPALSLGDYICYVDLNIGSTPCYVDDFTVVDTDPVRLPEASSEPFEIAGTTMTLGNDLALNFMVKTADITGEGWYAKIIHGDKVTAIPQSQWVINGSYTRISYRGIAAKEMVDDVTVTIYDSRGNLLSAKTDSIRSYAMRMFGKSGDAFDTVLADMLNYGAAAQIQFNYKTDDPANSQMTEAQKSKATTSVEMTNIRQTANGYLGTTLELESNILLNFFYSADYAGKTASVSYTDHYGIVHCYDVEIAASGTYGKVSVDKLVISDCSIPITVTVDGVSVIDSVESYCARMTRLALGEPLMKFAASARAYFNR